jgi:hypothetical protein
MAERYDTSVAWPLPLPQAPSDPFERAAMTNRRKYANVKGDTSNLEAVMQWLREQPLNYPSAPADPDQRVKDYDPNQMGHRRNVNAVRPASGEGRMEGDVTGTLSEDNPYLAALGLMPFGLKTIANTVAKAAPVVGGLLASTSEAEAGKLGPLWHAISGVKLPKPITEYSSTHVPRATMEGKTITPADLQGKEIYPTISDTTRADTTLTHIGDYKLPEPVPMQGGARFPDVKENRPEV